MAKAFGSRNKDLTCKFSGEVVEEDLVDASVRALVRAGARLDIKDRSGRTAAAVARENGLENIGKWLDGATRAAEDESTLTDALAVVPKGYGSTGKGGDPILRSGKKL